MFGKGHFVIPEKGREDRMSLCIAFIMNNETYVCSESRSSIPDNNSGTNPYTKRPNKSTPLSDNFTKIFNLPIEGRTIIGFATGDNTFGGKPVTEIIHGTCFLSSNTLLDCCSIIMQRLSEFGGTTYINLFEYISGDIVSVSGSLDNGKISTSQEVIRGNKDEVFYVYSGPKWTESLLYSMPFSPYGTEEEKIAAINAVYEAALKVSGILENTLGGPVHILRMRPGEPYKWLQI